MVFIKTGTPVQRYFSRVMLIWFLLFSSDSSEVAGTGSYDKADNLVWFVQITDIHLNQHDDPGRASDLENFLRYVITTITPEVVFFTGDLIDNRAKHGLSSVQLEEEWKEYKQILESSGILSMTKVLDIRGNHDMFGVIKTDDQHDYFSIYGAQGKQNPSSYSIQVKKPFGNYGFVMMDVSPKLGSRFPFNFFGEVTSDLITHLNTLSADTGRNNHTFWLGHYPTSTIGSSKFNIRSLLGLRASVYFCGHLHTLLHMVPQMYTMQPEGFLELELGDWRADRYYRIVAVDHDLISFMDYRFPKSVDETPNSVWPIVLVTNPKDANFLMPEKEPVNRISQSDHIRVLVWSNSTIKNVSLWIDDVYMGQAKQAASMFANAGPSPLYVLPWNPSELQDSSTLRVQVVDAAGNKRTITQPISVAGIPRRQFTYISQWILRSQIPLNLSVVFYMSWLFVFMVLVIPRCFGDNWLQFSRNKPSFFRGLYRFSHETSLVGPVIVFLLYELVGPIFLGFLIPGHFGALFSFGIVIGGTFVREGLTYFCELLQLWAFFLFVIVIGVRSLAQQQPISRRHICAVPIDLFTCTIIFTTLQFILILTTICLPYGFSAVCLSPGRLMPLAVSWYLAYRVSRFSFSRESRTATSRLLSNDGASAQSRSHETAAVSVSHSG